jgi:hypothetical protein
MSNFSRGYVNAPWDGAADVLSVVDDQPLPWPAGAIVKRVWLHAASPLDLGKVLTVGVTGDSSSLVPSFTSNDLDAWDIAYVPSGLVNAQASNDTVVVFGVSVDAGTINVIIEWNYFSDI